MKQQKVVLVALFLLLVIAGVVAAQSPAGTVLQRFVLNSGGLAESGSFSVQSVIGQPAAGKADSGSYRVVVGFLHPQQDPDDPTATPEATPTMGPSPTPTGTIEAPGQTPLYLPVTLGG